MLCQAHVNFYPLIFKDNLAFWRVAVMSRELATLSNATTLPVDSGRDPDSLG